jgi:endonuclease III
MAKLPVKKGPEKGVTGQLRKGKFKHVGPKVAVEIMDLLHKRYPDADCELTFKNDFELLTAVILSAQTTDANVNKATPGLFKRFPTAKALAEAPIDEVKDLIRSTGYYNAKAANIQACAKALVERFDGKVPSNIDDLTTLPGVGRKTANVVLGVIHGIPGWTVDTHVQRLSKRLGFSEEIDPAKIEKELQKLFPEQDWTKDSITLIWHGRRCCYARNPDCPACPVNHLCPSSLV